MSDPTAFFSSAGSSDPVSSESSFTAPCREEVPSRTGGARLRLLGSAAPARDAFCFYDPPYDRVVDDVLIRQFGKYLAPLQCLRYGVEGRPSAAGTPRADVLIEVGNRRIGFAYASDPASDLDADLDADAAAVCDALLVGDGVADVVYRLREADLVHRLPDVLWVVARWEAGLLSDRGRINLDRLASPEARQAHVSARAVEVRLRYAGPAHACSLVLNTGTEPADTLVVRRFDRRRPGPWSALYTGARRPVDPPMLDASTPRFARSA